MPNYCETCVILYNPNVLGEEKIRAALEVIDSNRTGLFRALYPEPLYSEGNEHWRGIFWGCRSEAHRGSMAWTKSPAGHLVIRFQSSWCPPIELFRNLKRETGLEWELAYCIEFCREAAGYTRHDWTEIKDIRDFYYPMGNEPLSVITLFEQGVYFKHDLSFDWSNPRDT